MADGVAKDGPVAGDQAVDQHKAGHRRHQPVIEDVEPAGPGNPLQSRIEEQQTDQAKPEGGDRIAEQPDDADSLVGETALAARRHDAHRHAKRHADDDADRGHLQRRGENTH
jgi:hypothetical protein